MNYLCGMTLNAVSTTSAHMMICCQCQYNTLTNKILALKARFIENVNFIDQQQSYSTRFYYKIMYTSISNRLILYIINLLNALQCVSLLNHILLAWLLNGMRKTKTKIHQRQINKNKIWTFHTLNSIYMFIGLDSLETLFCPSLYLYPSPSESNISTKPMMNHLNEWISLFLLFICLYFIIFSCSSSAFWIATKRTKKQTTCRTCVNRFTFCISLWYVCDNKSNAIASAMYFFNAIAVLFSRLTCNVNSFFFWFFFLYYCCCICIPLFFFCLVCFVHVSFCSADFYRIYSVYTFRSV